MKQYKNTYSGKVVNGKKLCSKCNELKTIENFSKVDTFEIKCGLVSACKECGLWRNRISSRMLKLEFLIAYGGKCVCCNESNIEFLTIEHVRGLGIPLHYNQISVLLRKLKTLGWPKEGYTILCFNCNMSTKHGTPCMHESGYKDYQKQFENELVRFNKSDEYFQLKNQLDKLK